MTKEALSATTTINAPAEVVFAILSDPTTHAAIDGTGWVREPLDGERLTRTGQVFRMAMYHPNHPTGRYEVSNRVRVYDPPRAISWEPGQRAPDNGTLNVGGWVWRYDLKPLSPSSTEVTLSYDWSAAGEMVRKRISFPPFAPDHLDNSLKHLSAAAELRVGRG